jgi:hypothetical protein
MSAAAPAAAEVHATLRVLAARLTADGHCLQAIKCWVAMLGASMLPSDEAGVRLNLARLLLEHTLNVGDAKQHLQKAVRACACVGVCAMCGRRGAQCRCLVCCCMPPRNIAERQGHAPALTSAPLAPASTQTPPPATRRSHCNCCRRCW